MKSLPNVEPFDVATITDEEGPLQALLTERGRRNAQAASRGPDLRSDRGADGPPRPDDREVVPEGPREPDAPQAGSIEAILAERGKTHGDFTDNARVMQALKRIVHSEVGWDRLTDVQREALHMILHKVGRIISGNPNTHDHWDDIAGYAKLVSERIEK